MSENLHLYECVSRLRLSLMLMTMDQRGVEEVEELGVVLGFELFFLGDVSCCWGVERREVDGSLPGMG